MNEWQVSDSYKFTPDKWGAIRLTEVDDLICLNVARKMGLDFEKTWLWSLKLG